MFDNKGEIHAEFYVHFISYLIIRFVTVDINKIHAALCVHIIP